MDDRGRRRQLRAAVATGDDQNLLSLLQESWPQHPLQLIGDGLLQTLSRGVIGAREPALACLAALGERDWEGDAELAAALAGRLGTGATPLPKPLPVDLEQLADVVEGDPVSGGGRIDRPMARCGPTRRSSTRLRSATKTRTRTIPSAGCASPTKAHVPATATWNASPPASRTPISPTDSAQPWTAAVPSRRFKNQPAQWPDLHTSWHAYSGDRHLGRARAWLAAEGYTPTPPAPRQSATPT